MVAYFASWYECTEAGHECNTHQCKGCKHVFPPDILFIAQESSDFDWQGELSLYCFPCVRFGPTYWKWYGDQDSGWNKVDVAKVILHPLELGKGKGVHGQHKIQGGYRNAEKAQSMLHGEFNKGIIKEKETQIKNNHEGEKNTQNGQKQKYLTSK